MSSPYRTPAELPPREKPSLFHRVLHAWCHLWRFHWFAFCAFREGKLEVHCNRCSRVYRLMAEADARWKAR